MTLRIGSLFAGYDGIGSVTYCNSRSVQRDPTTQLGADARPPHTHRPREAQPRSDVPTHTRRRLRRADRTRALVHTPAAMPGARGRCGMSTPAWITVLIDFPQHPAMELLVPNRAASEVAEYLAGVLGTVTPNTDIRLDLDPRSWQLIGTGRIETWDRRVVGTIRMRGATRLRSVA